MYLRFMNYPDGYEKIVGPFTFVQMRYGAIEDDSGAEIARLRDDGRWIFLEGDYTDVVFTPKHPYSD